MKIDVIPSSKTNDLDFGKVNRVFQLGNRQCIFTDNFTIKFTNSLCLQFFVKKNFNTVIPNIIYIAYNVISNLNKYKKTKVTSIESITVNNIHTEGIYKNFSVKGLNTYDYEPSVNFYVGIGNEPLMPYKGEIPKNFSKLDIHLSNSSTGKIRIYPHKRITCIVGKLEDYILYNNFLKTFLGNNTYKDT